MVAWNVWIKDPTCISNWFHVRTASSTSFLLSISGRIIHLKNVFPVNGPLLLNAHALSITHKLSVSPTWGTPWSYLCFIEVFHTNTVNDCAKISGSVSLAREEMASEAEATANHSSWICWANSMIWYLLSTYSMSGVILGNVISVLKELTFPWIPHWDMMAWREGLVHWDVFKRFFQVDSWPRALKVEGEEREIRLNHKKNILGSEHLFE